VSVTEQVLITQMSAAFPVFAFFNPFSVSFFSRYDVSEKLSLHPNVQVATVFP
jgi:hypothetical protein